VTPRIRVLWLIKGLGMGGAERLLETAIPYFDREKFDYEVAYCLAIKNDAVPALEEAKIPVHCLNFRKDYDLRGMYNLLRLLRERKPQILHLHLPYTGILGRISGRLSGVNAIVYTEHNVMERYHPLTRWLNLATYPMNVKVIAVSNEVERSIVRHRLSRRTDHIVIRNGIRLNGEKPMDQPEKTREALGIPAGHKVVGNIAHVRPEKGHEYLVRAAKLVLERRDDVTFVIVGREKIEGEIQRLEQLAMELHIRENIVFTGFREDVPELIRVFDVFVLSSLFEGLPLALLEAMVMGKPAVATSVGGVPEVIEDGINGFLVPARDPAALAGKILQLLDDNALRSDVSRKASSTVREHFNIASMVKKVEQVYYDVLDHHVKTS
jgi:glycosyltransferase involved in cell wall biosynthesis